MNSRGRIRVGGGGGGGGGSVSVVDAAVSGGNSERRWGRGGVNAEIQRAKGRRCSLGFSGGNEMVEEQGNGRDGRFGFG